MPPSLCLLTMRTLILTLLLCIVSPNQILMNITTTSTTIGTLTNLTLSMDRSKNRDGTAITPAVIASPIYNILISFDPAYGVIAGTTAVATYSTYTITPADPSVLVAYNSSLYGNTAIRITITNIRNPLISGISLSTYVKISDSNNALVDTAYNSLTYTFATFATGDIVYSFDPANVSTISNLALSIKSPYYNAAQGMYIEISLRRWWLRSMVNTTSTTIFSTASACVPLCSINRQTTATLVLFPNSSLASVYNVSGQVMRMTLNGIQSPPTLQQVDQVQVVIREPQYGSVVQKTDSLLLGASLPNSLESIFATTTNTIFQTVSLSLRFVSRNTFGPNDTLTLTLVAGSELASSDPANIILDSALVSGYQTDIQNLNTIVFSSFSFVSTNYAILDATITINKLVQASSTRPRAGNIVQLRRNGYLYGQDTFTYAVNRANISGIQVALGNNYANSATNCTWKLTFSKGVGQGDYIFLRVPEAISISTCQPQCVGCSCSITLPTINIPFTQLSISLTSPSLLLSLTLLTTQRNPISPVTSIQACTTDSLNYTKQCGSTSYPDIVQASISSETLSLASTNRMVYGIANYTFFYNLTNYDLQNGFLITIVPPVLAILDAGNVVCRVNGQVQCRVTINATGTYINTTVLSTTKIYTIVLNNVRNPASSQPFTISAKVAYISNQFYYSIQSDYFNATTPYQLTSGTHFTISTSSCKNSDANTLTITLNTTNLPFTLASQFPNSQYFHYQVTNQKTGVSTMLLYSGGNFLFPHRNWYSYEPISYTFVLYTADLLYLVWGFTVVEQNCRPDTIPILAYEFTGLPQDAGTLKIAYTHQYSPSLLPNSPNYSALLTFPQQYPLTLAPTSSSAFTTTIPSPRALSLHPTTNQQPILVEVGNFVNVVNVGNGYTNGALTMQIFQANYLIAEDNSTIVYRLGDVSDCGFPCKRCQGGNGITNGTCLQCYSQSLTSSYLLLTTISGSISTGSCVGACPTGTFTNTATRQCISCPISCSSCLSSSYCTGCTNNYYLFNNTCLTDCPSSFYPITSNQTCSACIQPCSTCASASVCQSCISGYNLYIGTCVATCPTGFIPQASPTGPICYSCSSPCSQCSQQLTTCTKCITGFFLTVNNTCVSQCTGSMIGYQGVCTTCGSTCYRCIDTPTQCIECSGVYLLHQGTCVTSCPGSYYASGSVCMPCPSECRQCSGPSTCSLCSPTYIFYNNSCLTSCPISMYISNSTTNTSLQQCRPCAVASCLACPSGPTVCVACAGGSYFYASTCVTGCPGGTYANGGNCSNCSEGCLQCTSQTQCTTCLASYALYQNACVGACPINMVEINNTCKQCNEYILNCQTCSSLGCSACLPSYSLFLSNTTTASCLLQCPTRYLSLTINLINQCIQCSTGCSSCTNTITNCTGCLSGYFYYEATCVTSCPGLLIPADGICRACVSPCATCANNDTMYCITCITGSYLLVANATRQCLVSCPTGYYQEPASMTCIGCPTGCTSCVQLGCLTCASSYFLVQKPATSYNGTLYDCYPQCPSYLPFVIPTKLCSQCSQHCLQCSPSDQICLQCSSPYLMFSKFCVLACSAPYQPINGHCLIPDSNNTTPTTNTTNTTTNTTTTTTTNTLINVPVPFTITAAVLCILVGVSRVQFVWSSITMGILGLVSALVPVCDGVYLGLIWGRYVLGVGVQEGLVLSQAFIYVRIGLYLLIAALGVIYASNILHAILGCGTFRADPLFETYSQKHKIANKAIFLLSLIVQHTFFTVYFCRLFNLSVFRAWLKSPHVLSCINYIWGLALVGNILAIISGILMLVKDSTLLYAGIDLIVVNGLVVMMGLLLLKKGKGSGWLREDFVDQPGYQVSDDEYSTKKVVMLGQDGDSDAHIDAQIGDSLEEAYGAKTKSHLLGKEKDDREKDLQNQEQNDEKGQFYFEQAVGDNIAPPQNIEQQTQGHLKSGNNSPDNGSQSTDPMKIQPSVNMLLTAQEMKPGLTSNDSILKQKGNQDTDTISMGWSSMEKQDRDSKVLKNQSKISQDKNIFQESDQEHDADKSQHINETQRSPNIGTNKLKASQNSSKSLRATPKLDKDQPEGKGIGNNLVTVAMNKSRRSGGRSSQQFSSISNSNDGTGKQTTKSSKNLRKSMQQGDRNSPKVLQRTGSKASHRMDKSQLMKVIQQQNQQNNPKNHPQEQKQEQHLYEEPEQVIARGQDRFLSNTLDQDNGDQAVGGIQRYLDGQDGSIRAKSRESSRMGSRSGRLFDKSPKKQQQKSKSKSPHALHKQQPYSFANSPRKEQQPQNKQHQNQFYTYPNQQTIEIPQNKQITGAMLIQFEQQEGNDHELNDNRNDFDQTAENKRRDRLFNTISGQGSRKPISTGALPYASKLRTMQLKNQLEQQRSVAKNNQHQSLNKRHLKSFRSRNISADKLRPSTSEYQSFARMGQHIVEDEGDERRNAKALMREIQRKQRLRSHKESLKKIYLKK